MQCLQQAVANGEHCLEKGLIVAEAEVADAEICRKLGELLSGGFC